MNKEQGQLLFYHVCIKYEQRKGKSLSRVQLFATPWTAAYQAPLSVGLSRQEYWSGVPSPSPKYEQSYPKLIPCAFGGNEGLGYKSCSELLTKPDNRITLHPIIFSALGPVQFCLETWLQMNLWDHFVLTGWSQKRNDPQNFYTLVPNESLGSFCSYRVKSKEKWPPKLLRPNPLELWKCYLTWNKGLCRCDEIKDVEMGGLSCIT